MLKSAIFLVLLQAAWSAQLPAQPSEQLTLDQVEQIRFCSTNLATFSAICTPKGFESLEMAKVTEWARDAEKCCTAWTGYRCMEAQAKSLNECRTVFPLMEQLWKQQFVNALVAAGCEDRCTRTR